MLYKIQLSFFSFEISLFQKFTILNFMHISIGVLPSSPYVITFEVVVLTPTELKVKFFYLLSVLITPYFTAISKYWKYKCIKQFKL